MTFKTTYLALGALLLSPQLILAADMTLVPVASYANRPEVIDKEGKRAAKILGEFARPGNQWFDKDYWDKWKADHNIGTDVVIFLPRDSSSAARLRLAGAIKAEGLAITLLDASAKSITPESILQADK